MKNFLYFLLGMMVLLLIMTITSSVANASCWHCQSPGETVIEQNIVEQTIKNEVNRSGAALGAVGGGHQVYWGNDNWKYSFTAAHYDDSFAASALIGKRVKGNIFHFSISTEDEESKYLKMFGFSGDF